MEIDRSVGGKVHSDLPLKGVFANHGSADFHGGSDRYVYDEVGNNLPVESVFGSDFFVELGVDIG